MKIDVNFFLEMQVNCRMKTNVRSLFEETAGRKQLINMINYSFVGMH